MDTNTATQPQTVPLADAARVATAANVAGHSAGWNNGLLIAGVAGLVVVLVVVIVAETAKVAAISSTSEAAFEAGANATQAAYQEKKRTL